MLRGLRTIRIPFITFSFHDKFGNMQPTVIVAGANHVKYCHTICSMIDKAAQKRGTGIAKRDPKYIQQKIEEGHAVIATFKNEVVGFCYIESWENKKFVVNSGLIVRQDFRQSGLAKAIKQKTFELSKRRFPQAKLFGITTSAAVMKINSALGYSPIAFSELTQDEDFWKGCQSCSNYDILQRTERKMCLCTGMICDLKTVKSPSAEKDKTRSWEGFKRFIKQQKVRIQLARKQLS